MAKAYKEPTGLAQAAFESSGSKVGLAMANRCSPTMRQVCLALRPTALSDAAASLNFLPSVGVGPRRPDGVFGTAEQRKQESPIPTLREHERRLDLRGSMMGGGIDGC